MERMIYDVDGQFTLDARALIRMAMRSKIQPREIMKALGSQCSVPGVSCDGALNRVYAKQGGVL